MIKSCHTSNANVLNLKELNCTQAVILLCNTLRITVFSSLIHKHTFQKANIAGFLSGFFKKMCSQFN